MDDFTFITSFIDPTHCCTWPHQTGNGSRQTKTQNSN